MNCDLFRKNLTDFLGETLPEAVMETMQAHTMKCQDCAFLFDEFTAIEKLIAVERKVEIRPFAETRVLAGIQSRLDKKDHAYILAWKNRLKPVLISLAIVAAVASGISLGYRGRTYTTVNESTGAQEPEIRNELNVPEFMNEDIINLN